MEVPICISLHMCHWGVSPWNKGRLTGQKPPLKLKEIWAIRIRLQMKNRLRDLAMFNLAIDSKLRACDLVSLRVRDVMRGKSIVHRAMILQRKTQQPVQFEITQQCRDSLQAWLECKKVEGQRFSVSQSVLALTSYIHAPVSPPCLRLGGGDWPKPGGLRNAFAQKGRNRR